MSAPGGDTEDGTSRAASSTTAGDRRVRDVQRQARPTLLLATGFALVAALFAALPHDTGAWLPLHLFLVGSLLLAISGASQLFAVTWSAGDAPGGRAVMTQRVLLSAGAAGVAAGRELAWPDALTGVAATAVVAALALLGVILVRIVASGRNRRFDAPVGSYVIALVAGIVGCVMGAALAAGPRSTGFRAAHETVNLLGLIGIVIAATLPFFVATEARTKMSPRADQRAQRLLGALLGVAVFVAGAGLAADARVVAALGLGAYALGLVAIVGLLPHLRRKQFRWAGPRLVGLLAGVGWWMGAVVVGAVHALRGHETFSDAVLLALVVGGYVQILLSSLAYLGPVLRGGGHLALSSGFRLTRSWITLVAVNTAAVLLVAGFRTAGTVALCVAATDTAVRAVMLRVNGSVIPRDPTGATP
ncbi:MAG: hypothetical protein M5U31_14910 [Acidimicrobiia bacterium]|nr:hypothetical protein [Acidimicrobiia bacterium]